MQKAAVETGRRGLKRIVKKGAESVPKVIVSYDV
jgi:hypothetical protein